MEEVIHGIGIGMMVIGMVILLAVGLIKLTWHGAASRQTNNIGYKQYKMPDLRVSDYAPDWYSATVAKNKYDEEEPVRLRMEIWKRRAEGERAYHEALHRHYQEQKIRRWKEGRPVTKEDPL